MDRIMALKKGNLDLLSRERYWGVNEAAMWSWRIDT
jgi:hypothetical protein